MAPAYNPFKPASYAYEPQTTIRARQASAVQAMAERISPLVAAGDPVSIQTARQIVRDSRAPSPVVQQAQAARRQATGEAFRSIANPPEAGAAGPDRPSFLGNVANAFRSLVPREVRDGLATGFGAATSASAFADLILPGDPGTAVKNAIERVPVIGTPLAVGLDAGLSPLSLASAGIGSTAAGGAALARLGSAGLAGRLAAGAIAPAVQGGIASNVAAQGVMGVGGYYGARAAGAATEALGGGETAQAVAGFAGGLAGGVAGLHGINATRSAWRATARQQAQEAMRAAAPEAFEQGRAAGQDLINPHYSTGGRAFPVPRAEDLGNVSNVDNYLAARIPADELATLRQFERRQLAGEIFAAERTAKEAQRQLRRANVSRETSAPAPALAGGAMRATPEQAADTVTLYRGDAQPTGPLSLPKGQPNALFGQGIYFTDSPEIARSYQVKGAERAPLFEPNVVTHFYRNGRLEPGQFSPADEAIEQFWKSRIGQLASLARREQKGQPLPYGMAGMPDPAEVQDAIGIVERAGGNAATEARELRRYVTGRYTPDTLDVVDLGRTSPTTQQFGIYPKGQFSGQQTELNVPRAVLNGALDADAPLPDDARDAIRRVIAETMNRGDGSQRTLRDLWRNIGPTEEAQVAIRRALSDLGYTGIRYDGGVTMGGGIRHNAYVFWDEQAIQRLQRGEGLRPPLMSGGAPMRDVSKSARPNQVLGDDAIAAIKSTPGTVIHPDGSIELDLVRYQVPDQAGADSVRAGTFYMPEAKSPYERHFRAPRGTDKAPSGYGGSDRVQVRTRFQDPLLVQAAAGGKAPEAAYDFLKGKGAYQRMREDVLKNGLGDFRRQGSNEHTWAVIELLSRYGIDDPIGYEAERIIQNSRGGNLLAYALQERIAAQAVKDAGYDGVIGYSKKLKGAPRLTEVFDVRSNEYPVPGEALPDMADFYAGRNQPPPGGGMPGMAGGADQPREPFMRGGRAAEVQRLQAQAQREVAETGAVSEETKKQLMETFGRSIGATTPEQQAAAREALYNGPVPTDMREVDTGLIEGFRAKLGAPTTGTVEDALSRARQADARPAPIAKDRLAKIREEAMRRFQEQQARGEEPPPAGLRGGAPDQPAEPFMRGDQQPSARERLAEYKRAADASRNPTAPRETIIPADDTVIGKNAAGETIYERSDGSRYRMRSDSPNTRPNGYPDFGGDLAPVEPQGQQPRPVDAEAVAASHTIAPGDAGRLPLEQIRTRPELFQARDTTPGTSFDERKVQNLVENWSPDRVDPLVVAPDPEGGYVVLSGHHRLEAARRVGAEDLPVRVVNADLTTSAGMNRAQTEAILGNFGQAEQNVRERVRAFSTLADHGMSADEIGAQARMSAEKVQRTLDVGHAGAAIVDRVTANPQLEGIAAEVGRFRRMFGVSEEDAQGTFDALVRRGKGETLPSPTAVRRMLDRLAPAFENRQLPGFEGNGFGGDSTPLYQAVREGAKLQDELLAAQRNINREIASVKSLGERAGVDVSQLEAAGQTELASINQRLGSLEAEVMSRVRTQAEAAAPRTAGQATLGEIAPQEPAVPRQQGPDLFEAAGMEAPVASRATVPDEPTFRQQPTPGPYVNNRPGVPDEPAFHALQQALAQEVDLRRSGQVMDEIAAGRRLQAGRLRRSFDAANASGASLDDRLSGASQAARVGPLRKTFAAPLEITDEARDALADHIQGVLEGEGEFTQWQGLRALKALIDGENVQPAQTALLKRVFGKDIGILIDEANAARPSPRAPLSDEALARIEAASAHREKQITRYQEQAEAQRALVAQLEGDLGMNPTSKRLQRVLAQAREGLERSEARAEQLLERRANFLRPVPRGVPAEQALARQRRTYGAIADLRAAQAAERAGVELTPRQAHMLEVARRQGQGTALEQALGDPPRPVRPGLGDQPPASDYGHQPGLFAPEPPERGVARVASLFQQLREDPSRTALDLLNAPRTLMASGDVSYSLRQNAMLAPAHPRAWLRSMKDQLTAWRSVEGAQAVTDRIVGNPLYPYLKKMGVEILDQAGHQDEAFLSRAVGDLPLVRQSSRAATAAGNSMRAGVAYDWLTSFTPEQLAAMPPSRLEAMGAFINAATGRGQLPEVLQTHAQTLNALFFAPRNLIGKVQANLAVFSRDAAVRKEAAKNLVAFYGTGIGILALAKLAGANVGVEPTSSDFGKITLPGGTRIDIWGGNQQLFRFVANLVTGEATSARTGQTYDQARGETVYRFLKSKLAPVPAAVVAGAQGESPSGEQLRFSPPAVGEQALRMVTPLFIQELVDATRGAGPVEGLVAGVGSAVGLGTQAYEQGAGDQLARQAFGKQYGELTAQQRNELAAAHPDLQGKILEEQAQAGGRGGQAAAFRQQAYQQQLASDQQLLEGKLTRQDWQQQRGDRTVRLRGQLEAVYGPGQAITDAQAAKDPLKRYLKAIADSTDPSTGAVDQGALERARAGWDQATNEAIDKSLGTSDTPLVRAYRKAANVYYELPRYQGYTADEARAIDELWSRARARAASTDDLAMSRALRQVLAQAGDVDPRIVTGVRRRIAGSLSTAPDRKRATRRDPLTAYFFGTPTPQQRAQAEQQLQQMRSEAA
jgi:hypothetical protein